MRHSRLKLSLLSLFLALVCITTAWGQPSGGDIGFFNSLEVNDSLYNFGYHRQTYVGTGSAFRSNFVGASGLTFDWRINGVSFFLGDASSSAIYHAGPFTTYMLGLRDTDRTNALVHKFNENDIADRVLNWAVNGANRTIDLSDDLTLLALTNTRLLSTSVAGAIGSTDLTAWVTGTANQVLIADDGDGTVTFSLPQNIHAGASPVFVTTNLTSLTATRLVSSDGANNLVSSDAAAWIDGTANQITVTDDGDGTVTLSEVPPVGTVTVGATGCDYTTIQAALTANATAILVLVYPGTYSGDTINFTANSQSVIGVGCERDVVITSADAQIMNFGAFSAICADNLTMEISAATTAKSVIVGSGFLELHSVVLRLSSAADIAGAAQPSCINTTGTIYMFNGMIDYNHTGESVAGVKAPISLGAGASVNCSRVVFDIDTQGDALASVAAYGASTGIFSPYRCNITVTNVPEAPGSGLEDTFTIGHAYATGSGSHELMGNVIRVENDGSTGVGIYVAGTVSVRVMQGHIQVISSTGTANSFYFGAAGAEIIAQVEDVIAANGVNNAAGGTFTHAYSPVDGEFHTSSNILSGDATDYILIDPDGGVGIQYAGASQPTRYYKNLVGMVADSGASGTVTVVQDHDGVGNKTYLRVSSGDAAQAGVFVKEFIVPDDLSAWTGANSFSVWTRSNDIANCTFVVTMEDGSGNVDATITGSDISPTVNDVWAETTLEPGSAVTPGETLRLIFTATNADADDTSDLGHDVQMSYLASN